MYAPHAGRWCGHGLIFSGPFVKSLIDCWAFKSGAACKYADVTQRKQHSHAPVGTQVGDISGPQRETNGEGGVFFFLPLTGCSVSRWSVCVYVFRERERGRHKWQDNRSVNALFSGKGADHQMKSGRCRLFSAPLVDVLRLQLAHRCPPERVDASHHLAFLCGSLSVCWCGDGSGGSLTKFLSDWWANSGFRALGGGATVAMISLALWWMDSVSGALSVHYLASSFPVGSHVPSYLIVWSRRFIRNHRGNSEFQFHGEFLPICLSDSANVPSL